MNDVTFALQWPGPNVCAGGGRTIGGIIVVHRYLRSRQRLLKFLDDCVDRDGLVVAWNHNGWPFCATFAGCSAIAIESEVTA
jgi:hypothetical protein